jgi:hypothetical protein
MLLIDSGSSFRPFCFRHANIHDHNIGLKPYRELDGFGAGSSYSDYILAQSFELVFQRQSDEIVVFRNENSSDCHEKTSSLEAGHIYPKRTLREILGNSCNHTIKV